MKTLQKKFHLVNLVVHGMLSASFISTMIGMLLPGSGSLWISQTINFLHPAFVGDTIKVIATVKKKSLATHMLVLKIEIKNQYEQSIITGESTVKMLKIEQESYSMITNKSKTILITGSSKGIGAAVARKLSEDGNITIINYVNSSESAEELVDEISSSGGRAKAFKGDISNIEEVKRIFKQTKNDYEPINGLVHCAAPENIPMPFEELGWEAFQHQIDVHIKGAFNCLKCVLPNMIEAKSGEIVFISSVYAQGVPPPQQARYVVAKSGLSALARSLAVEYGPKGIRVNTVSPGMTQTDMILHLPEKTKMLAKMQAPLRRLADPEDISNMVSFLMSDKAKHITGENFKVCGGSVM